MKTIQTLYRGFKGNVFDRFHLLFFIAMVGSAFSSTQAQRLTKDSFLSKFGPNAFVGYYAYTPPDYAANPTKKYPLLLCLHGKGEKAYMATDSSLLTLVKKYGPTHLIEQGRDFPFIVIAPQCPFEGWDNVTTDNYKTSLSRPGEFVDEILERMKKLYRVDVDRVYLTGYSMGGASTWSYIIEHPEKIAAAIPISSWIDNPVGACNIASGNVAVWTFQGSKDNAESVVNFTKSVNNCSPAPVDTVKTTIYEGLGHSGWDRTYDNTGAGIAPDNIYNWLLRHSKSSLVTDISEEAFRKSEFSVYPNPASYLLHISCHSEVGGEAQFRLMDELGHEVMSKSSTLHTGNNVLVFDLSGLNLGHYFLTVTEAGKRRTQKLVISN